MEGLQPSFVLLSQLRALHMLEHLKLLGWFRPLDWLPGWWDLRFDIYNGQTTDVATLFYKYRSKSLTEIHFQDKTFIGDVKKNPFVKNVPMKSTNAPLK